MTTTTPELSDSFYSDEMKLPSDTDLPERNGFWEMQAKRVARSPCTYLFASLILSFALAAYGVIVGEFSVSANNGGWQSRGTLIADRQTQLMLTDYFSYDLLYGGDEVWDELIDNVQPGWETDDDGDDRRRRGLVEDLVDNQEKGFPGSTMSLMVPRADRLTMMSGTTTDNTPRGRSLPFDMTQSFRRRLEENLDGCDTTFYEDPNKLMKNSRLWPVWQVQEAGGTAINANVIHDICVAESVTQEYLEAEGLCFGCDNGGCLPPYSIVLYARMQVNGGMDMSCEELRDAWTSSQQSETEQKWTDCVADIKAQPTDTDTLPTSCPEYFQTPLVTYTFDETSKTLYTSSIFATWDTDALYDHVDNFDRGESSATIEGAYDDQYESFILNYVESALNRDMSLAMASAFIVAIAVLIHTRSPFLTLIGLTQIMLSFPLSYFVYKLCAGLDFFPFLNFIGVFVVFALGAGDIFVAVDKWKNARLEYPTATTEYVAAVALPDAASAMFLTTFTTAVAFFATAICPVAPIKMFAIFLGLLVVFDYGMNVLLVFPALCIYDAKTAAVYNTDKSGPQRGCCGCCYSCSCFGLFGTQENEDGEKGAEQEEPGKESFIRRVLLGYYGVLHSVRWPLLIFSVAAFLFCAYFASTLALPTSGDVRLLGEDVQYEQNYIWRQTLLSTVLEKQGGSQAFVIWGVKPADTGDQNTPDSWSQLVLDPTFDPAQEESQIYLSEFCDNLFDEDFASRPASGDDTADYSCPIQRFNLWIKDEHEYHKENTDSTEETIYEKYCSNATGIPLPYEDFDSCIGNWAREVGETKILLRDGKVRIMYIPFVSRVRYDGKYDELDSEWHTIENWINKQDCPSGAANGYFTSFDFWWYDTNGQMLATAYSAAGIALGCAAVVILFSSKSFVLTIFSTMTIGYVLASVTACLVAMGWTLGFLESICFAILIGVSVDFVIHLAHAYSSAEIPPSSPDHTDDHVNDSSSNDSIRSFRMKSALINLGPSILATATTTILSAIIMLFTVINFFTKFALILFFTIIQASVGSFILFVVMTDCVGPAYPTYLYDKLIGRMDHPEENTGNKTPEKNKRIAAPMLDDKNSNAANEPYEGIETDMDGSKTSGETELNDGVEFSTGTARSLLQRWKEIEC